MTDGQTTKPREFTLLHLSGLFAVFGILLAILSPPTFVTPSREMEMEVVRCAYNLRLLSIAIQLYADEYGGRCPVDGDPPTLVGSLQLLSNGWHEAMFLYCRGDRRSGAQQEWEFSKLTTNNISYSYVPNLMWKSTNAVAIVALDRIDTAEKGSMWPSGGNHRSQGGNVLFTDGRIEFLEKLPATLRDKDGKPVVLSP